MILIKNGFVAELNSVVYNTTTNEFLILKCGNTINYAAYLFKISNNFYIETPYTLYKRDEKYDNLLYVGEYDDLIEYWKSCAMSAMQGYQESGGKIGLTADLLHKETAKLSFQMADAMLEEYMKRLVS